MTRLLSLINVVGSNSYVLKISIRAKKGEKNAIISNKNMSLCALIKQQTTIKSPKTGKVTVCHAICEKCRKLLRLSSRKRLSMDVY